VPHQSYCLRRIIPCREKRFRQASRELCACVFGGEREKYNVVDTYNSSPEILIDPGGFSHEGGMDATPLNACKSNRGLLAVGFVKFTDTSVWVSPFMKRVRIP
jgi:hypothetical protein